MDPYFLHADYVTPNAIASRGIISNAVVIYPMYAKPAMEMHTTSYVPIHATYTKREQLKSANARKYG
jgi:hypothetical protein